MKKNSIAVLLCGVSIVLSLLARYVNGFADGFYTYVYRPVSTVFAFVFGLVPFSVVEIGLYCVIGYFLFLIGSPIYRIIRKKKRTGSLKERWIRRVSNIVLGASILFFLYVINCGVNYHKTSFAQEEGFDATTYTTEELVQVCTTLTEQINALESSLTKDEKGNTVIDGDATQMAVDAMNSLATTYTSLSGYFPKPKGLVVAEILSYQDVTGIYSPFTVEANYNSDMPEYLWPFTMCHELSHLRGIMREEEANFVGFLACIQSEDAVVRYSGYMNAYTYCMNELYSYDYEQFATIREQLCDGANQDILNKHAFWEVYDTRIATVANKVNDTYLKANAQADGTASYDRVTGLILAYYRK